MKHFYLPLLAIFLLASCAQENLQPEENENNEKSSAETVQSPFVQGVSIVKFTDEMVSLVEDDISAGKLATRSMGLNQALDELEINSMKRLFPYAGQYEERTRKEGLHRWYVIEYSKNVAQTRAAAELESIDGVEIVEGKRRAKLLSFNDPRFENQWGLNPEVSPNANINVLPIWANYTTGNPDVIVSIVDAGVDLTHDDLKANIAADSLHYDSVSNKQGTSQITPGGHGTHVAGIIAAVNNNGTGICGVAGGDYANEVPGVKLMSCQIFKIIGGTTTNGNSAEAIKWGADHGAVISQNSWGYDYDANGDGYLSAVEREAALNGKIDASDKEAVDYFIKYAGCDGEGNQLPNSLMKGGVVIFAAGNEGIRNGAPANYDPIVAVGAISSDGKRASYSNYGDFVDIAAPGSEIYSTIVNSSYGTMSGTSMACPHVSGAAALLVSYFGGQGFTNEMLLEKLLNGSNKKATEGMEIGGLLDVMGSFSYGSTAVPNAVTDFKGEASSNNISLSWTATADNTQHPSYGYLIVYDTDRSKVEAAAPDSLNGASSVTVTDLASIGDAMSKTLSELEFSTQYFFKIYSYTYNNNYSSASSIISVTTGVNNPPVIETTYDGATSLKSYETITVPITISDPDGHSYTVDYTPGSDADSFSSNTITIVGSKAEEGTYTVVLTVTDSFGASSEFKFTYTILKNNPPEVLNNPDNMLLTGIGDAINMDLTQYFTDPDGETLKYIIEYSKANVVNLSIQGDSLTGTVSATGLTTVTITAYDAKGTSATISFQILVRDSSIKYVVYPNPVATNMMVSTGEDLENVQIKIYSQTGVEVFNGSVQASAFAPAKVDLSALAPGTYILTIKFSSGEFTQSLVKQ